MHLINGSIRARASASLLLSASLWAAPEGPTPSPDNQSLIEASIPSEIPHSSYFKEKRDDQKAGDSAMLFHIPGLTLNETQGPLGPTELRYRGLANNRFRIDLEGLSLNNPINGLSDANSLFLFAARRLDTNVQSLSISLPEVSQPFARGIVGYGTQNTMKMAASSGVRIDKQSTIFSATQMSSTDGDFTFVPKDKPRTSEPLTRLNNDQHRIQTVTKYQYRAEESSAHVLAAVNAHAGGIAGYAFSPTTHLRSEALFAGLGTGYKTKIHTSELSLGLSNSLFDYKSQDQPSANEHFMVSTHELSWGLDSLKLPPWIDLKMAQSFLVERAYSVDKTRLGGGFTMRRDMNFSGRLKPKTFATFGMTGYEKYGLLFKKDLGVSIEPLENMLLSARAVRSQRLPTFMEMYANNRFIAGNEDLDKESLWDFELGTKLSFFEHTSLQLTGYFGYVSNTIVYEPYMATRLRPTNTDSANRFGLDMDLSIEPSSWILFESKNAFLRTRIKATNAPIPHSPPFLGLTSIRIGPEDIGSISLSTRYKGASFANSYGAMRSDAYILFDALAAVPVGRFVALSLSVTNIFNTRTAQDSYEMPLPGTTFYGQISLGNS